MIQILSIANNLLMNNRVIVKYLVGGVA